MLDSAEGSTYTRPMPIIAALLCVIPAAFVVQQVEWPAIAEAALFVLVWGLAARLLFKGFVAWSTRSKDSPI